jgi:hypothetical protein
VSIALAALSYFKTIRSVPDVTRKVIECSDFQSEMKIASMDSPLGSRSFTKPPSPGKNCAADSLTLKTVRLLERLGSLIRMLLGDEPGAETPVFMGLSDRYISGLGADFGASHPPTEEPWGLADFA